MCTCEISDLGNIMSFSVYFHSFTHHLYYEKNYEKFMQIPKAFTFLSWQNSFSDSDTQDLLSISHQFQCNKSSQIKNIQLRLLG